MIELNDWQLRLLQTMEKENVKSYIKSFENDYYARIEDLFYCIDDTQDNREYAEEKLQQVIDDYEERLKDNNPNIVDVIWYKEQFTKAHEKIEQLEKKIEDIQSTLNEEDYDKLAMEGIEL